MTQRVKKLKRFPTLWAVTWWPICYRDGQPLPQPQPASHAYTQWQADHSDGRSKRKPASLDPSLRLSGSITPVVGVVDASHHSDLDPKTPSHHSDGRRNSYILVGVQGPCSRPDVVNATDSPQAKAARGLP